VDFLPGVIGGQTRDDDLDAGTGGEACERLAEHRVGGVLLALDHGEQAVVGVVKREQGPDAALQVVVKAFEGDDEGDRRAVRLVPIGGLAVDPADELARLYEHQQCLHAPGEQQQQQRVPDPEAERVHGQKGLTIGR